MRHDTLNAPLHPIFSIRLMHNFLEEHGFDADAALVAAGIFPSDLPNMAASISGLQELRMQRAFVAATGYRPDLWLELGLRYRAPVFGCLGLAMLTSANLMDYARLPTMRAYTYNLCVGHPIHVEGQLVGLEIDSSEVPRDIQEFCLLQSVGCVLALYSDLWGAQFPFSYIRVALPEPDGLSNRLSYNIRFEAERTVFYWLPQVSERPFPFADRTLHSILVDQLNKVFCETVSADGFILRLRQYLERASLAEVSVEDAARQLGLAPRTLQRRLSDHGRSFRGMLEKTRRERSIKLLLATDQPVSEIAISVGFADITAFDHAFRRWTGESPGQFRSGAAETKPAD